MLTQPFEQAAKFARLVVLSATEIVNQAANRAWTPPPNLSVAEWSEQNIWLGGDSPEKGHYRCDRTPYVRGILECLSPQHPARWIAWKKGTQVGGTRVGLNWVAFKVANQPKPMIITLPSEGVAKEWSDQRLTQLVDETPALQGLIGDSKRKGTGNTTYLKKIRGTSATIKIAWSSSAKKLRSTPAENLLSDEVDGFEGDVEGEGDPIFLLNRRFTNFPRGKHYMTSTPTHEPSRIDREFRNGDQRYFFLPCPHCRHYQRLVFDRLRWPKRKVGEKAVERKMRYAAVSYHCIGCGEKIQERFKTQMLNEGMWVATADHPELAEKGFPADAMETIRPIIAAMAKAEFASFDLSALYSPIGWYSWATAAKEWEAANASAKPNELKSFINTVLAEVWKEKGETPDAKRLYDRRERQHTIGVVPRGGLLVVAAADVQGDRIEFEAVAFGRNSEKWSVYYEVIQPQRRDEQGNMVACRTSDPEPWQRLKELIDQDWPHADGGHLAISAAAIDTGYNAETAYKFCRKFPQPAHGPAGSRVVSHRTVVPIKGGHSHYKLIEKVSDIDAARKRGGLRIVTVGSVAATQQVFDALRLDAPLDGEPFPRGYYHLPDYGFSYFEGLTAETRIVTAKGITFHKDGRNEPLDLAKYELAMAALCGIERFNEERWRALERQLEQSRPDSRPKAPPPPPAPAEKDDWLGGRGDDWF